MSASPIGFTDFALRNLTPPMTGQVTYEDANSPLRVRISATGKITFLAFVGSGKRHPVGHYPEITLSQAAKSLQRDERGIRGVLSRRQAGPRHGALWRGHSRCPCRD